MKISRRNFLGALSASVAAGIPAAGPANVLASVLGPMAGPQPADALSRLSWTSFHSNLFTDFEFSNLQNGRRTGRATRLKLSAVAGEPPPGANGSEPACFVLTFKGRADVDGPRLSQGTYAVDHFALGRFDLFISDASLVDGEYVYTAVINRVTE